MYVYGIETILNLTHACKMRELLSMHGLSEIAKLYYLLHHHPLLIIFQLGEHDDSPGVLLKKDGNCT